MCLGECQHLESLENYSHKSRKHRLAQWWLESVFMTSRVTHPKIMSRSWHRLISSKSLCSKHHTTWAPLIHTGSVCVARCCIPKMSPVPVQATVQGKYPYCVWDRPIPRTYVWANYFDSVFGKSKTSPVKEDIHDTGPAPTTTMCLWPALPEMPQVCRYHDQQVRRYHDQIVKLVLQASQ